LFGALQARCGYTPAQIRKMTLDDVSRLFAFWRKYPPLDVLFGAVHGFKPPEDGPPTESKYMTADDARRLMAATGGKIPGIGRA
jgi:hypothetical protein